MLTDISLTHSDLTHAVFLIHGRSLTRRASLTHTILPTHAGALTRGVSLTHRASLPHGASHTRAVFFAHVVSSAAVPLSHMACWEARTPAHS